MQDVLAVPAANHDGLCLSIHPHHLVAGSNVQIESGPQLLRSLHQQRGVILYLSAHVIWQPAVRVRNVGALLKDNDLCGFIEAAQARSRTHPCCYSPNDNCAHAGDPPIV